MKTKGFIKKIKNVISKVKGMFTKERRNKKTIDIKKLKVMRKRKEKKRKEKKCKGTDDSVKVISDPVEVIVPENFVSKDFFGSKLGKGE